VGDRAWCVTMAAVVGDDATPLRALATAITLSRSPMVVEAPGWRIWKVVGGEGGRKS
jgi:hypothetical protein